jgi:hypothetical protein
MSSSFYHPSLVLEKIISCKIIQILSSVFSITRWINLQYLTENSNSELK